MRTRNHLTSPRSRRRWTVAGAALVAMVVVAGCNELTVTEHAVYTTAPTQHVTGTVATRAADPLVQVTVNGVPASIDAPNYEAEIPLDGMQVFNPVLVTARYASGDTVRRRSTVVHADGTHAELVAAGEANPSALTTRLAPNGIAKLAPAVNASIAVNPSPFRLPPATFGGFPSYTLTEAGAPLFGPRSISLEYPGYLRGTVRFAYLRHDLRLAGQFGDQCTFSVTFDLVTAAARYDVVADPTTGSGLRVTPSQPLSLLPNTRVDGCTSLTGGLLSDVVNFVRAQTATRLQAWLQDPDGAGGAEAPVAGAINAVIASFTLDGPIGGPESGIDLSAPLAASPNDSGGLTTVNDATFRTIGAATGAPEQTASLAFGSRSISPAPPTTPSGAPYDLAVGGSVAALNQVLAATTERGFLNTTITNHNGQPLTYNGLNALVAFGPPLPDDRPVHLVVTPELAPAITDATPPAGKIGVLHVGGYRVTVRFSDNDATVVDFVTDFDTEADLVLAANALHLAASPPDADQVHIDVTERASNVNDAAARAVFTELEPEITTDLQALPALTMPSLPHLTAERLDVRRSASGCYLFANLATR